MSNPFERFNIRHLSASSLNKWRAQPGLWAINYLLKVYDEGSAAMWRGNAVEGGVEAWLRKRDRDLALETAMSTFEANAQGDLDDDVEKERVLIPGMLGQAISALEHAPPLLMTQAKIEHWLDGVPVPLIGYVDFVLDGHWLFDLKTTKALPSTPKPEHARQVALYRAARNECGGLLYVSAKRNEGPFKPPYCIDDPEPHLAALRRDALALMNFLDRYEDPTEAACSLPMDVDHFMFGDASRAKAMELIT